MCIFYIVYFSFVSSLFFSLSFQSIFLFCSLNLSLSNVLLSSYHYSSFFVYLTRFSRFQFLTMVTYFRRVKIIRAHLARCWLWLMMMTRPFHFSCGVPALFFRCLMQTSADSSLLTNGQYTPPTTYDITSRKWLKTSVSLKFS